MNAFREDFDSLVPQNSYDRRGFIKTSLSAGFAAAVMPVMAQTMIHTDSTGLTAGEVKIKTADGEMPAYRAQPAKGTHFPVILVVQEIFGVHEHIKDICRRLAKLGYLAVASELYARQGDASKEPNMADLITKIVSKVPDAQVMSDLDATVAWAHAHGGNTAKLGITGFCWGGRITWMYAAHNPQVKAGVAWYGRPTGATNAMTPTNPVDVAAQIKIPVLGLYGEADQGIPVVTLNQMKAALAAAGNDKCEFVLYKDAPHGFNADYRPSYRKEAAEDGWTRLRAWFKDNGVA
jgi:carboxymethylenebutenolidase